MTTPADADRATHTKNCQDPGCSSDYAVVIVRVEEATVDFLCEFHHLLLMMGVIQRAAEMGVLPDTDTAPAAAQT